MKRLLLLFLLLLEPHPPLCSRGRRAVHHREPSRTSTHRSDGQAPESIAVKGYKSTHCVRRSSEADYRHPIRRYLAPANKHRPGHTSDEGKQPPTGVLLVNSDTRDTTSHRSTRLTATERFPPADQFSTNKRPSHWSVLQPSNHDEGIIPYTRSITHFGASSKIVPCAVTMGTPRP